MDANQSETPTPKDGELQPDFAIRFHESTMDSIPDTDARTQRCFREWRDSVGDEPEVAIGRKYHKATEFIERRDIPVFEEHVIPSRRSKDGKRLVPAVRYDRRALASICKNMNASIRDVGKFCPITDGHTSDNITDPSPEVIAYSGTYRLGMIGNEKPRYAIFSDEYHRKDREHVLLGKRGRSVEVLPLPDVHKRTFYPIAALGADEPRLNLPPARYFNRPNEHGEPIEVERYMMVAPGGASTFIPSDDQNDRDKYGSEQSELPRNVIQQMMEAWTASAPVQWVIGKMEEEGKAGSPNPLVHQAPQMADMPADDVSQQPGQQPGQDPPGVPGMDMDPDTSGEPDGDMDIDDSDDFGSPAPQQAAGGVPQQPVKGPNQMTEPNKEQYSVKSAGFQNLEARLTLLESENANLKAKLLGAERYSKLSTLKSRGIEVDIPGELERVASQSDEQFASHVEYIEKYHRRSPTAVADFSDVINAGRQNDAPADSNEFGELSSADSEGVMKYAMKHNESNRDDQIDYVQARERYIATKKTASTSVAG